VVVEQGLTDRASEYLRLREAVGHAGVGCSLGLNKRLLIIGSHPKTARRERFVASVMGFLGKLIGI